MGQSTRPVRYAYMLCPAHGGCSRLRDVIMLMAMAAAYRLYPTLAMAVLFDAGQLLLQRCIQTHSAPVMMLRLLLHDDAVMMAITTKRRMSDLS